MPRKFSIAAAGLRKKSWLVKSARNVMCRSVAECLRVKDTNVSLQFQIDSGYPMTAAV
jgi:hypothetical protein